MSESLLTPKNTKMIRRATIAGIVAVLLVVFFPFLTIKSGEVGVLLNFGSISERALLPGLHFIIPIYQSVEIVPVHPLTISSREAAATHDLQNVTTAVSVTFHIDPDNAPKFYRDFRTVGIMTGRVIDPSVSNDVKAVTADYNAEELITKRQIVDDRIRDLIIKSLTPYHLQIEAVNTANFAFSESYSKAIEDKQVAQQQALQAEYTLQQAKISAQQQVVQASAAAEAAIATANGTAKSLLINADAQAKANDLIAKSLTAPIIEAKAIEKWSGTMPTYMSSGSALPFLGPNVLQGH